MKNKILFSRENGTVIVPSKREEDGAFDVYANFTQGYLVIPPHKTIMIPTGLRSAFSSDYVAIVKERGSTGSKGIGQRCGVIDSGYRGLWFIPVTNHNDVNLIIRKEECNTSSDDVFGTPYIEYPYEKAIAQVVMVEVPKLSIEEVTKESILEITSERGEGSLGSSNK